MNLIVNKKKPVITIIITTCIIIIIIAVQEKIHVRAISIKIKRKRELVFKFFEIV